MAFSRNVDVLPPDYDQEKNGREDAKRIQSLRWRVLAGTFLLFAAVSLIWVWSRPAIFQSQAILHFTYPEQIGRELSTIPAEQLQLNQRRLTSFRVLEMLSEQLANEHYLSLSPEALSEIVSTDVDLESRVINLYSTGHDSALLEPVLSSWMELYLASLELETESKQDDDILDTQNKIGVLEDKIQTQNQVIESFAQQNNIISLERDENRTLNKIKGLSASLDKADADLALATAEHKQAIEADAAGEGLTHPDDRREINNMRNRVTRLKTELDDLAEVYTPEYMALDPKIVSKQRSFEKAQVRLEGLIDTSKKNYLAYTVQRMETLQENGNQLNAQLVELTEQAQAFNKKLREYQDLNTILEQLQRQAQSLRDRLVQKEVDQPFRAKISVLETPFVPVFPISPDYWLDTAIAAGASAGGALLCLLIFSFIVRPQQPQTNVTSYTVVPNGPALDPAADPALAYQQQQQLGQQAPIPQLENTQVQSAPSRILTEEECQQLYDNSNRQTALVVLLGLSGLDKQELLNIKLADVSQGTSELRVTGRYGRTIALSDTAASVLGSYTMDDESGDTPLLHGFSSAEDIDQSLVNAAHDARINFSDDVTFDVLRHTLITYLVGTGVRLNDLERLVGFIPVDSLSRYRQVSRPDNQVDPDTFSTGYPLNW